MERVLGSDNSQEMMLMVYSISCWIFNIYKYSCRNIYTQFYKYIDKSILYFSFISFKCVLFGILITSCKVQCPSPVPI